MPKPQRMSVQDIAEVLVSEMEEMKKTARTLHRAVEDSKRVLPAIGEQLRRTEQTKLEVNTEPMRAILSRFETLSQQRQVLPTWAGLSLLVVSLMAAFGVYFSVQQRGRAEKLENAVGIYQQYLRETDQGGRFQEWLDSPAPAESAPTGGDSE